MADGGGVPERRGELGLGSARGGEEEKSKLAS